MNSEPTYFELFSISPSYNLDTDELHRKWLSLQSGHHPDLAQRFPVEQRQAAVQNATRFIAEVNQAYQTLQDPISRAIYLLEQLGESFGAEYTIEDDELLMHVMDLRQRYEEYLKSGDQTKMRNLLIEVDRLYQNSIERCAELFNHTQLDSGRIRSIKHEIWRMRFYHKLKKLAKTS